MAWDCKYIAEFTDILGLDWKIEAEDETAHSGDPVTMQLSGGPLTIAHLSNSDHIFDSPIKGSKIDFTVESTNFQFIDFYTTEDLRWRISIYYGVTLYWRGYILTDNYSEPYDSEKFSVTISASDGLGYLKNYLYKYQTTDPDDTYYSDRRLESQIILDILGKIGYTSFTEYVNLYEESMTATSGYSPFDQIKIDADLFRDMYCYDVLEAILRKYNAVIRVIAGQPTIYRPVELAGATVYGRIFTGPATKSSTTLTPAQYISRRGAITDLRDVNGGTLMIQAPAKKVTIIQDFGDKESWLDNWKLESNTFTGSLAFGYTVDKWTVTGFAAAEVYPIGIAVAGETEGIAINGRQDYGTNHTSKYLSQSFGVYGIVSAGDVMCLEFEYQWFNRSGGDHNSQTLYFKLKADNSNYSLDEIDDSYAQWVTPAVEMSLLEDVYDGDSGWKTWKRLFTGMDVVGPYTLTFYALDDSFSIYLGIRNVKLTATNDSIAVKKTFKTFQLNNWVIFKYKKKTQRLLTDNKQIVEYQWVKYNSITGKELEYDIMLGDVTKSGSGGAGIDNVIEQFAGSLASNVRTLYQIVHTVTLSADSADGSIDITCNGLTKTATYSSSPTDTATAFAAANNTAWAATGVTLTSSGVDLIFTGSVAGYEFIGDTEVTNRTGGLDGAVDLTQPTAYSDVIAYSTDWNTRGGSESKELLQIMCDEIADQYSRPRQFLNLPIMEDKRLSNTPHVNIIGNLQDSKNKVSGNNRIFVINQGTFNVRDREWNIDCNEII